MGTEENSTTGQDDGSEWMLVEIFGHRRHAGRVREEDRFGTKMMRIDVPTVERVPAASAEDKPTLRATGYVTHWYGGASIFSATPTDEATALRQNAPYQEPQRYLGPPDDDGDDITF